MTDQTPPTPRRILDPAAIPLVVGGAVLVLAAAWLWLTPRPAPPPDAAATAVAALERRVVALEAGEARLAAVERRRVPDIAPLEARIAALETRPGVDLGPIERRVAALPPPADLKPLEERIEALTRRIAVAEARPAVDPAAFAPRAAAETLAARAERLSERLDALAARQQASDAEQIRRAEDLARSLNDRLAQQASAETERVAAAGNAIAQRIAGAESTLAGRIAALELAQARIAALEARTARAAALDMMRLRLDAGQPLGNALAPFPAAPPELARFAAAAPPTEAALRLSFEDTARAARAASEAARDGQGVLESAASRLSGLVTVRRGEDVVWGDAAAAEIERARRALEAGDLDGAIARLGRLPPRAQEAMRPWVEQARALSAARAALAALGAG